MVYRIWREGFRCTGEYSLHCLIGESEGTDFRDACIRFSEREENHVFAKHFDRDALTYWGCGLFQSEAEAAKAFG